MGGGDPEARRSRAEPERAPGRRLPSKEGSPPPISGTVISRAPDRPAQRVLGLGAGSVCSEAVIVYETYVVD